MKARVQPPVVAKDIQAFIDDNEISVFFRTINELKYVLFTVERDISIPFIM